MSRIRLASIAFNQPRVVREQIRLLDAYLLDPFDLTVFDNSSDEDAAAEIRLACGDGGASYERLGAVVQYEHYIALNYAFDQVRGEPYYGFLDHDVFPVRPTRLLPLIEEAGFYGIGQRHPGAGHFYLWPGFCFFAAAWVADRKIDFGGVRGPDPADYGDTGSAMWPLFEGEEWSRLYRAEHGYRAIRPPDQYGLQSWGYEVMGDFIHFSNASHWMDVPDPDERERLLFAVLEAL